MGMMAGQLNRHIQVQRFVSIGTNGFGGAEGDWQNVGSRLAARRIDVSDGEKFQAGRWENTLVTRFVVRATTFTRDIRRSDQILHDGQIFAVDGIKEVPPGRRFLEITAKSVGEP